MEGSDAKRLKQLEDENQRLKQIVADLSLNNQALKWLFKKTNSDVLKKEIANELQEELNGANNA